MKIILAMFSLFLLSCEARHKIIEGGKTASPLPSVSMRAGEQSVIHGIACGEELSKAPCCVFDFSVNGSSTTINGITNGIGILYCGDQAVAGVFVAKPGYQLE